MPSGEMIRHPELSANVVSFCRMLRERGFPAGPAEEAGVLEALSLIDVGNPEEFRFALRTILTGSRKELALFDELFPMFWGGSVTRKQQKGETEIAADLLAKKQRNQKSSLLSWNSQSETEGED